VRAFVLAGGLGTRLAPLGDRFGGVPKPLVPVGGRPLLERQLEWLAGHGVREAVLCTGHGGERVLEALGDGARLGTRLHYSAEPEPLGTAGALRLARGHVRGPALVLNGDTLAPCDPWALERARWESGALGAVALFHVAEASARGRVERDAGGRVARFIEKDAAHPGPAWVNGGVYAFAPAVWSYIPSAGAVSLERDVLPRIAAEGRLVGVEAEGEFWDIGTPEDWARADRRFAS
jgi:NDP-sugar pyrophosphorylase family protein